MRCITRNEVCVGYRDESDLIFQHETDKTILKNAIVDDESSTISTFSSSVSAASARSRSRSLTRLEVSSASSASPLSLDPSPTWDVDTFDSEPIEEPVSQFFDNYVLFPCSDVSSTGFLEHLPSLFKESNVQGRYALRWAVQAAAYADISSKENSKAAAKKAVQLYSKALAALSESLGRRGKPPDDHDLMTVVILDIFEVC